MKLLEKYICKSYITTFLFCITLLMVLGVIGDILGFLDDIFKNNIPLASILLFYFYFAPFAFVNMVPFACLISAVFVFNNLSKNHEITAIITSGISIWKVIKPVFLVTCILCLATFIVNEKLVPTAMEKATRIRQEELETGDEKEKGTIKNLAVYGKGDQIIFAKEYNPGKRELGNVIIHKQNKDRVIVKKISARSVKWRDDGFWLGTDVMVFKMGPDGEFTWGPEVHKNRKMPIREGPDDFLNTQWDPKLMSYRQLERYIKILRFSSPAAVRRFLVDLNYKLAFPFMAMVIILVGIPFSIATGRANALIGMAKGITLPMLYLPVMAFSLALGKGGVLPPVLAAWLSNIVFAVWGIYLINKRS